MVLAPFSDLDSRLGPPFGLGLVTAHGKRLGVNFGIERFLFFRCHRRKRFALGAVLAVLALAGGSGVVELSLAIAAAKPFAFRSSIFSSKEIA
jgi:hypothetical protein